MTKGKKMTRSVSGMMMLALVACSGGGTSASGSVVTPQSTPSPAASATATPTPSYTPIAARVPTTGISIPVGKCVNLGNHMEPPNEGDWGRAIADGDFAIIKAAGFDTIRLPVRWSTHAGTSAPYTIDAAWMKRVKHVVDAARGAGLNVMLNLHNYEEMTTAPAAHAVRFAELWRQIGVAFAGYPTDSLWFELFNEPNGALNDGNLRGVLDPALAAVRATNPTRPVIIGGQNWSGVSSLDTLSLPADPYVIATIHSYDPFTFTHQGATWATPMPPLGRNYGSAADFAELDATLAKVKGFMDRTGRSVFVGEYGAYDHPSVPLAERIKYYGAVSSAYASIGVQSCAWAYTNTFRLRDVNAWLPGMVEAIRTTTTLQ